MENVKERPAFFSLCLHLLVAHAPCIIQA
jgi:hypothetical protein